MPELPEVETVRRGLAPVLEGVSLEHVETRRADLRFPFPDNFVARLKGAAIETLDRRGKYLIGHLSTGESLIMHLGMSGRFDVVQNFDARKELPGTAKHDHVIFEVGKKSKAVRIVYNDVRRFGFMDIVRTAELEGCKHFKGMGPEPLGNGFSAQALGEALKKKSSPIKTALLDQRVVAGLGNIYVCEALFRAGISPRRQSKSVAGRRSERLYPIIVEVLRDAIAAGGSTLKDFAATDGELGYFQHRFDVYGREGEDCRNCGAEILRFVQGGRSTFYCSTCQR